MESPKRDPNPAASHSRATYFILLSLAPGPRHGYAIMKDVHSLSHGRVTRSAPAPCIPPSNACWMRAGSCRVD